MIMLAKASIVPLVCLASSTPTLAPERDLEDRLVHILELHARQARGVAASIEVGEEFTFDHAEGRIHFADNQPASVSTELPGAVLFEFLTSIAAMRLVEEGHLSLGAPVELPGFEVEDHVITIRHLLEHTSGLPPTPRMFDPEEATWAPLVVAGRGQDRGAGQVYRSANTWVLGAVVEQVGGAPLRQAIEGLVFEPAGLEETRWVAGTRHTLDDVGIRIESGAEVYRDPTATLRFEAGDLVTTTADLRQLLRAFADGEVISTSSVSHMLNKIRLSDGTELNYGYGLHRSSLNEIPGFSVSGTNGHEKLHVAWYPMLDTVLALGADSPEPDISGLQRRLIREIFDLPGPAMEYRQLPDLAHEIYPGIYRLGCNRLDVSESGQGLRLVGASFPELRLRYVGGNTFVSRDDGDSVVRFKLGYDGHAHAMIINIGGSRVEAIRIDH